MKTAINALLRILFFMTSCLVFVTKSYALDCPAGSVDSGGVCVSACEVLKGSNRTVSWDAYIYGEQPTGYCYGALGAPIYCGMEKAVIAISTDSPDFQFWQTKFRFTGKECTRRNHFTGGTPKLYPWEGDHNMNGILDVDEDWDGDGIPNGVDKNPNKSDNTLEDKNNNNVPDKLEPYLDTLESTEVIKYDISCPAGVPESKCMTLLNLAKASEKVSVTNRELTKVVKDLVSKSASKSDVENVNYSIRSALSQMVDKVTKTEASLVDKAKRSDDLLTDLVDNKIIGAIDGIPDSIAAKQQLETNKIIKAIDSIDTGLTQRQDLFLAKAASAQMNTELIQDLTLKVEDVDYNLADAKKEVIDQVKSSQRKTTQATGREFMRLNRALSTLDDSISQDFVALRSFLSDKMDNQDKRNETNIDNAVSKLKTSIEDSTTGLSSKIEQSGSELSGKIDGLSDKIDGMGGLDDATKDAIKGIRDLLGADSGFSAPVVTDDFMGGFIFDADSFKDITAEIEVLKENYKTETEQFKTLFSIDTKAFKDGKYVEHQLDLTVAGHKQSFKTGVLSALLDNAEIIKAIVLFIFVLIGIKMMGSN
ncbi:hypothetical protein [Vibrio tasmaniensis]|uniref:hypothetical protein n=1 Tax=Vibrio tasmaniensis TaxID=212663 RepID=UPI00107FB213|nr:hypothetical protein [Vibrio tasmaniensis]